MRFEDALSHIPLSSRFIRGFAERLPFSRNSKKAMNQMFTAGFGLQGTRLKALSAPRRISGSVAPLARFISAITSAFLLLRDSVAPFCARSRGALASFLAFAPLFAFGAPFFCLALFFERAFSGATAAPCSATVAALSLVSTFVIRFILFCAGFAHDDSSLGLDETASQIFKNCGRKTKVSWDALF
jgi:hypothetical protein